MRLFDMLKKLFTSKSYGHSEQVEVGDYNDYAHLKRRRKKKYRPLTRRGGRTYWKGRAVDDDDFQANPKAIREYNLFVKKRNRQIRIKNKRIRRTNRHKRKR